jgi:predicted amidohydrolase YtcJ
MRVLFNARIKTLDPARPGATALAIHAGRIVLTGSDAEIIHAIGGRANHEVLNAFEQVRGYESENHPGALHHRVEHVQVLLPGDLDRFTRYNISGRSIINSGPRIASSLA